MNVESDIAVGIPSCRPQMLKTNSDAKVAKLDKKLKMVELQLRKEKLDKDSKGNEGDIVQGEGYVVTDPLNSLLEKLKNMDK